MKQSQQEHLPWPECNNITKRKLDTSNKSELNLQCRSSIWVSVCLLKLMCYDEFYDANTKKNKTKQQPKTQIKKQHFFFQQNTNLAANFDYPSNLSNSIITTLINTKRGKKTSQYDLFRKIIDESSSNFLIFKQFFNSNQSIYF